MRVYNFSAGPSVLPLDVLEKAGAEITDANGTGQSVMEMSHRSKDFKVIIDEAQALLRELMGISDNYHVLFLQGGASLQFSMIPLNIACVEHGEPKRKTSYIDTGVWAKKAAEERQNTQRQKSAFHLKTKRTATSRKRPLPIRKMLIIT